MTKSRCDSASLSPPAAHVVLTPCSPFAHFLLTFWEQNFGLEAAAPEPAAVAPPEPVARVSTNPFDSPVPVARPEPALAQAEPVATTGGGGGGLSLREKVRMRESARMAVGATVAVLPVLQVGFFLFFCDSQ